MFHTFAPALRREVDWRVGWDRIPALWRKGSGERERPEKISHFLFG